MINLRNDLNYHPIISTRTAFFSLTTYPILLCKGATQAWNVLRAIPLSRYSLATNEEAEGESNRKYFKPRTINFAALFLYTFPLISAATPVYLITKESSKINQKFAEYDQDFLKIISGRLGTNEIVRLNSKALENMNSMVNSSKQVLLFSRIMSFGCLCNVVLLFSIMVFSYGRILQAVQYQIKTYRLAMKQRQALEVLSRTQEISPDVSTSTINLHSKGLELLPASHTANFSGSQNDSLQSNKSTHGNLSKRSLNESLKKISSFLPSLRKNPTLTQYTFRLTRLNPRVGHDLNPRDLQEWELINRQLLSSQHQALKKHRVNLIWQVACSTMIIFSFTGINLLILLNWLQIPNRHSLAYLTWFIISWASISWVVTLGIPFGLAACLVAISSPIVGLRENKERVESLEEDEDARKKYLKTFV